MGGRSRFRSRNQTILLSRLEEAYQKHDCKTLDDAIRYLRSTYTDYSRMKQQSFAYNVRQAYNELDQTLQKYSRKLDDKCVSDVEDVMDLEVHSTSNCDATSNSMSSACDLMKSALRECYGRSKAEEMKEVDKNFEMEEGKKDKVLTVNGDSKELCSASVEQVKGKEGEPRFSNFGGMKGLLDKLEMSLILPLSFPHIPKRLGAKLMSGILFHGPPGCGKTTLARAIANESGLPFYNILATDIVSGVSGASEENIRELFSKAVKTSPSIVFIDEIDAIASKRENLQRGMDCRIVTQLMTCMDDSCKQGYVHVIGATNRPDAIDPAVRRRFNQEILLGVPDENARVEILSVLTRNVTRRSL